QNANKDDYAIYQAGETLVIEYKEKDGFDWGKNDFKLQEMNLVSTMPALSALDAKGMGNVHFDSFKSDHFKLDVKGPVNVYGEVYANDASIYLAGKSEADITGEVNHLHAEVKLASKLFAYNLLAAEAIIE